MAMDLPQALTLIVQCLESPRDVVAFLYALPPAALDAPLAAILELLVRPSMVAHMWPKLNLVDLASIDTPLARVALPVFTSVRSSELEYFTCLATAPPPDDDEKYEEKYAVSRFIEFASQWPLKMTFVDATWRRKVGSAVFCSLLHRCTRLRSIELDGGENAGDVLAAVTTPAHRVRSLCVDMTTAPAAGDWSSLLKPWLTSGHARHITFLSGRHLGDGDAAALSLALATTSSLRGLAIWGADDLVRALLVLNRPLHHFTEIQVETSSVKFLGFFLTRLDFTKLTSLKLDCSTDHADTLRLVRHMPLLRHLALTNGCVGFAFADASTWPDLESIAFERVSLASTAQIALQAYFDRVQNLREVSFEGPESMAATSFFDWSYALTQLIANGLTVAKLMDTDLDDTCAALLALALREGCNASSPLHLDLTENDIGIKGVGALVKALATCLYVRIEIVCKSFDLLAPYKAEIEAFAAFHGVATTITNELYTLCSPSTHFQYYDAM
ncbi:hypothetical protein SPRG_07641 [Saprolegnia parasitica CBS 223.65]|uniref:Uncharacterized protein n=1 Tax=Saprolegnia parasitica (strain CBS 223.65) TaxID=695850 RepID=A0A067CJD8_SAPPC|nr:hypothetical protein SPRG_07641 [Saprolegnia parasitica CBS 223.65]KDO26927.1 hypothetical protein SPRG_07641 [Saprolegnia parasitica CBS 223.65]|eukprot:XP_012202309.1 hypothetical protein SPRG_07641 [Saprolegnia parasitica CBS 223.65]